MATNLIVNNSLMNKSLLNQEQYQSLLYNQCTNQLNQRFQINPMNMMMNPYQYYQFVQNNNCQNNFPMKKSFLYAQNMNKYSQLNPNYFSRNGNCIKNNNYHKGKKQKNKKFYFNKYEKEALSKINEDTFYYEKNQKKGSIENHSTQFSDNSSITKTEYNTKEKMILEKEKEALKLKNNNEDKKEDEDLYLISEENIPNSRRFSQRSKRSCDSDNSNCSKSTSNTLNEIVKENVKDDVSFNKKENLEKNDEKTEYKGNPVFENTEILNVSVKLAENNYAVFKLKRYDDIFMTIQYFCEINNLDEEMIKPLIIKSLCAINTIYKVMNSKINEENLKVLKEIKNEK